MSAAGRPMTAEAELAELRRQLQHETAHDALTGLPNRSRLLDRLAEEVRLSPPGVPGPTVLVVSIDSFRAVDDSLGHQAADRVLVDVGRRLLELAGPDDLVARLRGDEFAVLLRTADRESAMRFGHQIEEAIHRPHRPGQRPLWLSASIGICLPHPDATATTYLRDADTAMHAAKSRGAGLVEVFDPDMRTTVVDRFETTTALAEALAAGSGLLLHYQPVFDLHTSEVVGAEALVRWRHPERGMVPPDQFIGLAEESGLIAELGRWVVRTAVRQLAGWKTLTGDREFRVHVNLSPVEFRHPGLVEGVTDALAAYDVDPAGLLLEITETGLMTGGGEPLDLLHKLRDAGVGLGIDDFGTGYSSIGYLGRLPVDTVKLDRALIAGIGSSPYEYGLARAILELLDSAGLRVVAEGIETVAQVAHLRALNCRWGQGFHLARPALPEATTALLMSGTRR
ncbi:MAG TPA: bifunctional diguanylate cyclase/phosphodiesterase [Kribbellaceae bacterium]|jgi:diguanylate cyclase (GGDEF)-like protein